MDAGTLRRMQAVTCETWRVEGPQAPQHIGDLAWQCYQHSGRADEWRVRLWQRNGRDVAWAWLRLPDSELDYCIQPGFREPLAGELLGWFERVVPGKRLFAVGHTGDEVMARILEGRGYRLDESHPPLAFHHRDLDSAPVPEAPEGFRLRTVETADLEERVGLHRAVWHPSRVTADSYRNVQSGWPYRADLDCVVEAPGGRLVAYCLAWLDEENRAGELEPVGTHPDFRRLGLASAVSRFALHRLAGLGAERAMVYAVVDPGNLGPKTLYESIGFHEVSRALRYVRCR